MKNKVSPLLSIKRLLLMQKRVFYKKSFLLILILISLFSFAIFFTSKSNGSFIKIALYANSSTDNIGNSICIQLLNDSRKNFSFINYTLFENKENALSSVNSEENDAAWIFYDDINEKMKKSAYNEMIENVVSIYQKNDSIKLSFAKEILYSKLFSYFSFLTYKAFLQNRNFINDDFSEQNIEYVYNDTINKNNLFIVKKNGISNDTNFLLSSLRGLLSLFVMLCAFAGTLYHIEDKKRGFALFYTKQVVIFDAILIMIFMMFLLKIFTNPLYEFLATILLYISLYYFTEILANLSKSTNFFVCFIPIIVILTLVFTPIFLDLSIFKHFQIIFPQYYYLISIYYPKNFISSIIYTGTLWAINFLLRKIRSQEM